VPLIFRWPGKIEAATRCDQAVINLDFYPTLMDVSGGPLAGVELDGVSLWPLLSGNSPVLEERSLYFHFPIYLQAYRAGYDQGRDPLFRTRPGSVIRDGEWKLHYYYEDDGVELYKLSDDPGERHNLSLINTSKSKEMLRKLKVWLSAENAPVDFQENPEFDATFERLKINEIH
jgi:arylsulfatase A-like enzyme